MMVAAGAVDVAVREFFLRGGAYFGDLNLKIQILAGERMIAIDGNHIADHLSDGDGSGTGIRLHLELHSCAHIGDAAE